MTITFKNVYTAVSTNFDLEPVLKQYVATYPDQGLSNYRIVFECQGEHHPDSKSYIIVYEYKTGRKAPDWTEFLKSYCTVNRLAFHIQSDGKTFPDISNELKALSGQK